MLNVIAIMGRLVRDPELRQTTTGKTVASFRIACDRGRRDANGQTQADFFDVTAWDKIAEFVTKYFAKGSLIAIDGRLQSRNYQDKSGSNRTAIEILAHNVHFAVAKARTRLHGSPMLLPRQHRPPALTASPLLTIRATCRSDGTAIKKRTIEYG